jgi:hypothetical protein
MTILCTYFDSAFLPRGLALYDSLVRHWDDFTLLALCLDDEAGLALRKLSLPRVVPLSLSELEAIDPSLAEARSSRSRVGYYMTCTPVLLRYALTQADVAVYLDADLFFFSPPASMWAEFAKGSIYVHEHRPGFPDWDPSAGRFNVGLVAVRTDEQGRGCVELWRTRCLDWCEHDRVDGRFGDQAYLDEWPDRFDRLVISRNHGVGAGPWNIGDHVYTRNDQGCVLVDDSPLVFFHFTRLQQIAPGLVRTYACSYTDKVDSVVRRYVYRPYLRSLQSQLPRIKAAGVSLPNAFGRVPGARDDVPVRGQREPRPTWMRARSLAKGLKSGELMISWPSLALTACLAIMQLKM